MKLEGKVAVVTGGGTGMGRACCFALAHKGAAVVVNYAKSQEKAEDAARQIEAQGGRAIAVRADVSSDAEARALIAAATERFGRLDILVNNAGYTRFTPHRELELLTEELLDRTLAVNTKGPLYCARAAIPAMLQNGGGHIINITSIAAKLGSGSSIIYCASKAALSVMTKSLARAFAPEIRVNAIAPGFVDTKFANWPDGMVERMKQNVHTERIVTVEDIAAAVVYLVTEGSILTGEEIVIDGGLVSLGSRS
ncbi:MAG TPA: glucose 1-dehydrogenase [Chthonomonadaceae bacterium]|nr:glucose 1-dehydrogenase [Chthonomonadaceae bacterium]